MQWPQVIYLSIMAVAPLTAGVVLIAVGERELGMLFLGLGGGAVGTKIGDATVMRPRAKQ